ncbi:MAG TPA: hypothetical protein VLW54_14395, partial [Candidatus Acidoferrales bacterium]|nr:hypothetical protein [Candidatus Acidoferrales bacterium]
GSATDDIDLSYCYHCYYYDPEDCPCAEPVVVTSPGTVQVPSSLLVSSVTLLPTGSSGEYGCSPGQDYGIKVAITYQVLDQNQKAIQSNQMEPQETITNQCINGACTNPQPTYMDIGPSRISGTSKFTNSSGQFKDAPVGICGVNSFTATATQDVQILLSGVGYHVRTNNFSISGPASGQGSIIAIPDIDASRP